MNIELRNISYSARLSQETSAYAAVIYVDGKKAGTVENDGHGGQTFVHIDKALRNAVEADIMARPDVSDFEPVPAFFDDLLSLHLLRKDAKRNTSGRIAYVKKGEDCVRVTKKVDERTLAAWRQQLQARGDAVLDEQALYERMLAEVLAERAKWAAAA